MIANGAPAGRLFTSFVGGTSGAWKVTSLDAVRGEPLPHVPRVAISESPESPARGALWRLTGIRSNVRYVQRAEKEELAAQHEGLGRPMATRAALIPILKSAAWWDLAQDERREVFETRSRHIAESLNFMPAIQRQLYHCRDLGGAFDFLTWFEFAPADAERFEELVRYLRQTEEWRYVEREVDLRLSREA